MSVLRVLSLSWNLNTHEPPPSSPTHSLTDRLLQTALDHEPPPDLVVLHVHEVQSQVFAPLTSLRFYAGYSTLPSHPDPLLRQWTTLLSGSLKKKFPQANYECLYSGHLIAIGLVVFSLTLGSDVEVDKTNTRKKRLDVESIYSGVVDTGLLGVYGNKGAVSCSLDLRLTLTDNDDDEEEECYFLSLCVTSLHLGPHPGESSFTWRNAEFQSIFDTLLLYPVSGEGGPRLLLDHDVLLLAGDLNYRLFDIDQNSASKRYGLPVGGTGIQSQEEPGKRKRFDMDHDRVCEWIDSGDVSRLLQFDELSYARQSLQVPPLDALQEAPISFLPTYKLVIPKSGSVGRRTRARDRFSRKRVPAYTDRILYKSVFTPVSVRQYETVEGLGFSDHQPVWALFELSLQRKRHEYLVHDERSLVLGVRGLRVRRFLSINGMRLVVLGVILIWYFILMS